MEKLFLEKPTINRKEDAIDYLKEHVIYNSDMNGTGSMDRCLDDLSYEEWIIEQEKRGEYKYATSINRCPFVVRESDNRIIGMINIRYQISKELLNNGASHIGYGIRPTERRKGYAKIALYLGIIEEQKMGEDNILLDCNLDNIGSNKTILALGGVLDKTEIDPNDNEMTNYYYINVNDSIIKYRDDYSFII